MQPELARTIFDAISGGKSLRSICEQVGVAKTTILDQIKKDPALSDQYARAREDMAEHFADEVIEIADNNQISPDARRIMVDARKWSAGKMAPKKYGDKVDMSLAGEIGLKISKIVTEIVDPVDDPAKFDG